LLLKKILAKEAPEVSIESVTDAEVVGRTFTITAVVPTKDPWKPDYGDASSADYKTYLTNVATTVNQIASRISGSLVDAASVVTGVTDIDYEITKLEKSASNTVNIRAVLKLKGDTPDVAATELLLKKILAKEAPEVSIESVTAAEVVAPVEKTFTIAGLYPTEDSWKPEYSNASSAAYKNYVSATNAEVSKMVSSVSKSLGNAASKLTGVKDIDYEITELVQSATGTVQVRFALKLKGATTDIGAAEAFLKTAIASQAPNVIIESISASGKMVVSLTMVFFALGMFMF